MKPRATRAGALLLLIGTAATALTTGQATAQRLDVGARAAEDNIRRLNQLDEESRIRQEGDAVVADPLKRRELPPAGGATVLLQSVTFSPSSVFLSEQELAVIAAKYRGERVDFRKISELVRDVNDLYAEKGVVTAAAILPPQQLATGNLQIQLIEGRLGAAAIVGERRNTNEFIFDRVTVANGDIVDVPTAAKDIRYFNETNRAQLRMLLQPGASFGYTDLLLGITEPPAHELQFFFDNKGVYSTGELQGSFVYRNYGMAGRDDTFMAFGSVAEGSLAGTARYELPVHSSGTRIALSATASSVSFVNGPATILDITGKSSSANITLTQPLAVTERWSVFADLSGYMGHSRSWSADVPLVNNDTVKFAPGITVAYTGDRGVTRGQVQAVYATSTNNIFGFERDIRLLTGSISGRYNLDRGQSIIAVGAFQHTDEQLLPGDLLFQIGGPTTIRGYPSTGIAGDSGYYGSLELHQGNFLNKSGLDGYVFTDFGEVFSTFPDRTTLFSAGVGMAYDINETGRFEISAAFPLLDALSNQDSLVINAMLTLNGL
ncbi:ShlB/FhaC/HecB family hemolysin secretion/activation protein [Falsihalocynthiibacter sp. SS001]|uniref:ShlB/FhaC/HecB family hemolysin secretion/activation protein n=1 Tax=Falsihalocynthiibacter sp. SS001 TaxID=3349698 RepID=UPI0036D33B85